MNHTSQHVSRVLPISWIVRVGSAFFQRESGDLDPARETAATWWRYTDAVRVADALGGVVERER